MTLFSEILSVIPVPKLLLQRVGIFKENEDFTRIYNEAKKVHLFLFIMPQITHYAQCLNIAI